MPGESPWTDEPGRLQSIVSESDTNEVTEHPGTRERGGKNRRSKMILTEGREEGVGEYTWKLTRFEKAGKMASKKRCLN